MDVPVIQKKDPNALHVEAPILFQATLVFVNHQGQATTMSFACPPGLYPNPEYIVTLVKEAQREGLKALKLQSKDLSWRLPSPTEFVRITSQNPNLQAQSKYAEPFTVKLVQEEATENDNNSN